MTVAPRCLAHWQAMSPTPPAAAWNTMVSPGRIRVVWLRRYCAVIPFSIMAAAVLSSTPAGMGTTRSAGITRSSE
jgi:hypothetical protein